VLGRALVLVVRGLGLLSRLVAHLIRTLAAAATHLFDIAIIIPLQVERLVRRRDPGAAASLGGPPLRNPAERTEKGTLVRRAVLARRASEVARLHASLPDAEVICV
jgi:hypothetical protein